MGTTRVKVAQARSTTVKESIKSHGPY